jgi:uncharacterized protein (DUF433 family)
MTEKEAPPLAFSRDPERLEGQLTFEGTRVPVWVLFNYLIDEAALYVFRQAYPHVPVESLELAIEQACLLLTGQSSDGR